MSLSFYPPTRPSSVGEVLDLAFRIFKVTLIRALPYGIVAVIAQQLTSLYNFGRVAPAHAHAPAVFANPLVGGSIFVLGVLLALLAWSSMLLCQRSIVEHRFQSARVELGAALHRMVSFVPATLLFLAVVAGDFALLWALPAAYHAQARIVLLVVSLYLAVLLSCTWPAVLFGGLGPVAALRQSVRLVWGNWWRVALVYMVSVIIVLVIAILLGALIATLVAWLGVGVPVMTSVVYAEVANALGAFMAPFAGALLLAVYGDLRVRREGTDLQQRIVGAVAE
jgi:hypothetical protein